MAAADRIETFAMRLPDPVQPVIPKESGHARIVSLPQAWSGFQIDETVWHRRPKQLVTVHSGQCSQYGSDDWQRFHREHYLQISMNRRGNCRGKCRRWVILQQLEEETHPQTDLPNSRRG
jgi:hypothetical protein